MLNYIWIAFFLLSFVVASIRLLFFGDTEVFKLLIDGTFDAAKVAIMDIALPLAGVMTLWLGLLKIGENAGAIRFLSRMVSPFFKRLFPDVPSHHPATGQMMMNFSANLLGLDNAATPFGLKAMSSLQELNPNKEEASNAQIMFLVLHTSGLTLIPLSIMAQRAVLGANDPSDVFIPCLIATYVATLVGMLAVAIKQGIYLFDKVLLSWLLSITTFIVGLVWYLNAYLTKEEIEVFSKVSSNALLMTIIIAFITGGLIKKINVYESFIEGAKSGFETSVKIIPYLVGMLVAISVLRTSGVLLYVVDGFRFVFTQMGLHTEFVDALPTAIMKPFSGSGSRAMMIDAMKTHGADSFVGRLSCVFQGSADTTFYIVALYFGSVGIKRTRYAISFGLIADLAGIIAAICVSYLFFG